MYVMKLMSYVDSSKNQTIELNYAPLYAKENFENCYKQYHELGANGVMDKLRDEFLGLPNTK